METNVVKIKIWDLDMGCHQTRVTLNIPTDFHEKNGFVGKGPSLFLNYP